MESKPQKRSFQNRVVLYILAIVWLVASGVLLQWSVFMYKSVIYDISMLDFAIRNIFRLLLGILAFIFGIWTYRFKAGGWVKVVFYISIGALLSTLLFGKAFGGATRWLKIGPFTFQPSEFVKYVLIMYIAYLSTGEGKIKTVSVFWKALAVSSMVSFIILFQPNFSTAAVLLLSVIVTLFLLGATIPQMIVASGIITTLALSAFSMFGHVRERMNIFLGKDGSSHKAAQVVQAKVSIVRGGIFGRGPGMGLQKLGYLPSADKDYAFSNMFEEYGLVGIPGGALWITLTITLITWIGLWAAQKNRDPFRRFVMIGFTVTFFSFSFAHITVNLDLLPPTGLPLPFVSYGGSALVANALALGYVFRGVLEAQQT